MTFFFLAKRGKRECLQNTFSEQSWEPSTPVINLRPTNCGNSAQLRMVMFRTAFVSISCIRNYRRTYSRLLLTCLCCRDPNKWQCLITFVSPCPSNGFQVASVFSLQGLSFFTSVVIIRAHPVIKECPDLVLKCWFNQLR